MTIMIERGEDPKFTEKQVGGISKDQYYTEGVVNDPEKAVGLKKTTLPGEEVTQVFDDGEEYFCLGLA